MSKAIIKAKIASGAKIVDVRSPGEFAEKHYPGSINIPVNSLLSQASKLGNKNTIIVVYCASGGRSAVAAELLRAQGYSQVFDGGGIGSMPH